MFCKKSYTRSKLKIRGFLTGGTPQSGTSRRNFSTGMAAQGPPGRKVKELTNGEREAIVSFLLGRLHDGALPRGIIKETAENFGVSRQTVSKIWNISVNARHNGNFSLSVVHKKNFGVRNNLIYDPYALKSELKELKLGQRYTLRAASKNLGVATSTLLRAMEEGAIRSHSSRLRPSLTEENKLHRYEFCRGEIRGNGLFKDMLDRVHVDEKWFYCDLVTRRVLLADDETEPYRTVKHKSHIDKVMFLCAVARPRFDHTENRIWDGKIGIWPFARLSPALRSSANRPAGTMEWKTFKVDKEAYKTMMIEQVLPAIMEKCPIAMLDGGVWIQHDNAPAHIRNDDADFLAAVQATGVDVKIYCQPPNSPDLNVLDLGFFNSLQSIVAKEGTRNKDILIQVVKEKFDNYPQGKINRVFLSLQMAMQEILLCHGGNDYKLKHMSKSQLERNGNLPMSIEASAGVLEMIETVHGGVDGDGD